MPFDLVDVWAAPDAAVDQAPLPAAAARPPAVSARASDALPADSDPALLRALLDELAELRREQAHRDTLLLLVGGLLLAALIVPSGRATDRLPAPP
jgi:hypothetical protein